MSDFRIITCELGNVSTNCYLIYNEKSREAVIVDPADNSPFILNKCREEDIKPVAILLTHGHFDHILAAEDIKRGFHLPIYAGKDEKELLGDSSINLSNMINEKVTLIADHWVNDKDIIKLAGFSIEIINTPGHTLGSVCYYLKDENLLISGDTLFLNSLGRTDLPTSDTSSIIKSIKDKLFILPDETIVYPGHGESTTIAHERKHNPVAAYTG